MKNAHLIHFSDDYHDDTFTPPAERTPTVTNRNFLIGTCYISGGIHNIVTNRQKSIDLQYHKAASLQVYPPRYKKDNWSQEKKDINDFSGHPGMRVYDAFTTAMNQCAQYGDFSTVPSDVGNVQVSIRCNFGCSILLSPFFYLFYQARMVNKIVAGFISSPPSDLYVCRAHPDGCGHTLNVGETVIVDAKFCTFHNGHWIMPIRRVEKGKRSCCVGVFKCLCDQISLYGNRVGQVFRLQYMDGSNTVQSIDKPNCSIPQDIDIRATKKAKLSDDSVSEDNDESTNEKDGKKVRSGVIITLPEHNKRMDEAVKSSRTMNLVADYFNVAYIRFIDGGYPMTHQETRDAADDPIIDGSCEEKSADIDSDSIQFVAQTYCSPGETVKHNKRSCSSKYK